MDPRNIAEYAEVAVEAAGTVAGAITAVGVAIADDTVLQSDGDNSLMLATLMFLKQSGGQLVEPPA
jgi:hypothetical protein